MNLVSYSSSLILIESAFTLVNTVCSCATCCSYLWSNFIGDPSSPFELSLIFLIMWSCWYILSSISMTFFTSSATFCAGFTLGINDLLEVRVLGCCIWLFSGDWLITRLCSLEKYWKGRGGTATVYPFTLLTLCWPSWMIPLLASPM